ncbi:hypothetical protein CAY60_005775 [Shouchella clausii]|jgi:hypothetical protein|uniref:Uncharacterized protein n=3 Tax=Shouchella TaxID=2893057 RepID=Q5WF80_SHOC1|nr:MULTISPECIES: hypothetical protein [Shouchella]MCM3313173.1 hypothetical protein [Psychrobacillus sp. MER TA 17]ALA54652.1 hypothetical protein DB29_03824 [Shouchella clausii]KKI87553.1 hypothetical protein WZ76_03475 [Shouchella clausii]MBU3230639.1 hypothetical protein [Shouchella clausii]MBU3263286.1 hypothetical protein [Shouchella clausii]
MPAYKVVLSFIDGTMDEWLFEENPNLKISEWTKQQTGWVNIQGTYVNTNTVKRIETIEIDEQTDR